MRLSHDMRPYNLIYIYYKVYPTVQHTYNIIYHIAITINNMLTL